MTEDPEWLKTYRPRRYWFRIFSAERRAERACVTPHPEPVRHSAKKSAEYKPPSPSFPKVVRSNKSSRHGFWNRGFRVCHFCACDLVMTIGKPNTLTVDHLTPLSRGGTNAPDNKAPCCWECNNAKGALTEAEFRFYRSANIKPPAIPETPEDVARIEAESMATYLAIMVLVAEKMRAV